MTFDAANPFLDEDQDELRAYVNPSNNGSEVTAADLKTAYENARYYINLLNAGKMNYQVQFQTATESGYRQSASFRRPQAVPTATTAAEGATD